MSHYTSWHHIKVEEFFNRCNWQGELPLMSEATSTRENYQISWQRMKVEEFFNRCNWQGELPLVSEATSSMVHRQTDWQCMKVEEFFNRCNWQGQPLHDSNQHCIDPSAYLKAPVKEFFEFIPWEGKPEIGSLPNKLTLPTPMATFTPTLTDLSDLF